MASSSGVKSYSTLPTLIYDVLNAEHKPLSLNELVKRIEEKKNLFSVRGETVNLEHIGNTLAGMTDPNSKNGGKWQGKVMRSSGPPPRMYWAVPADGALPPLPPPSRNVPPLSTVQKAVPTTGYDYPLLLKSLFASVDEAEVRAVWEALKPVSTDVGYFDLCGAHDLDSHWGHPRLFGLFGNCRNKTGKDTLKYLETTYKVEWKEWSEIAKGAAVELFWGAALGLVDIGVKGITPHFELGLCGNFRAKLNAFEGDGLYRSPKNEELRRAIRAMEAKEARDLLDRNAWAGINVYCEFLEDPTFLAREGGETPLQLIRRTSAEDLYGILCRHKAKAVWERFKDPRGAMRILTRELSHPEREDDSPYESMAWFTFRLVGDNPPPPPPQPVE